MNNTLLSVKVGIIHHGLATYIVGILGEDLGKMHTGPRIKQVISVNRST